MLYLECLVSDRNTNCLKFSGLKGCYLTLSLEVIGLRDSVKGLFFLREFVKRQVCVIKIPKTVRDCVNLFKDVIDFVNCMFFAQF